MSNYNDLKTRIAAAIHANGVEEITGNVLQSVLIDMVDAIGDEFSLAGVATTTTVPGTPDNKTAYIATAAGTYTNFLDSNNNPIVVPANALSALLTYDPTAGHWTGTTFGTLAPGIIGTNELADGAVTTPKIADSAVTSAKIGANAVTSAKINNGAVSEQKLATAVQDKLNNAVTLDGAQTITGDKEFTQPIQALELYGDGDLSVHALDDLTLQSHNGDVEIAADDDINLNGARVFVNTELNVDAGLEVGTDAGGVNSIKATGKILTNGQEVATKAYTDTQLATKQDAIADLATIRSGAALGATAYQKPSGGIPESDLSVSVQTSLGKADTALQDIPDGGVTTPKIADEAVTLAKIASAAIDSTPTANSDNLVTSGGVFDAVEGIVGGYAITEQGGISTGGASVGKNQASTTRARTTEFLHAPLTITAMEGYRIYVVFEYSLNAVLGDLATSYTPWNGAGDLVTEIVLSDTTKKYRVSFAKITTTDTITVDEAKTVAYHRGKEENDILELQKKVLKTPEKIYPTDYRKFINVNKPLGTVIDVSAPITNANFAYVLTPCKEGDAFKVSGGGGSGAQTWAFLDKDYKLLAKQGSAAHLTDVDCVAPLGAAFGLFQGYMTELSVVAVQGGSLQSVVERTFYDVYVSSLQGITFDYDTLIACYDALLNDNPDVMSKSTIGTSVQGKSLYEYSIVRPDYNTSGMRSPDTIIPRKKMLIITGIHGIERAAVNALLIMLKDYLNGDGRLAFLNSYDLYICPCGNPDGFNAGTRVNANSVNINRNFNANWVLTPAGNDYSGAAPADQPETQALQAMINSHSDVIVAVDFHNSGYGNEISYLGSADNLGAHTEDIKKMYLKETDKDISMWVNYRGVAADDIFAYTGVINAGGTCGVYMKTIIEESYTFEAAYNVDGVELNGILSCHTSSDAFGTLLRSFDKILGQL